MYLTPLWKHLKWLSSVLASVRDFGQSGSVNGRMEEARKCEGNGALGNLDGIAKSTGIGRRVSRDARKSMSMSMSYC